jgi:hypothetical protein
VPLFLLLAVGLMAQAANRDWQTGTWAKPMTVAATGTPYRNYAIETSRIRLDLQETIARGVPAIASTLETPVMFVIEKDVVYVKQGDAERVLRLIKQSEKLRTYDAAGSGHFIKALANEGLIITLDDNSVWEIDPRGQFKSVNWEALQGVSVRAIREERGFNYEIGNTDVDEAVLARLAR